MFPGISVDGTCKLSTSTLAPRVWLPASAARDLLPSPALLRPISWDMGHGSYHTAELRVHRFLDHDSCRCNSVVLSCTALAAIQPGRQLLHSFRGLLFQRLSHIAARQSQTQNSPQRVCQGVCHSLHHTEVSPQSQQRLQPGSRQGLTALRSAACAEWHSSCAHRWWYASARARFCSVALSATCTGMLQVVSPP